MALLTGLVGILPAALSPTRKQITISTTSLDFHSALPIFPETQTKFITSGNIMQNSQIELLTASFEGHAQKTEHGVEYWLARDLQDLLGYTEWRNFLKIIDKAETACEVSGQRITDHFVDVNKMVQIGSDSQREIEDLMLTRYACYSLSPKTFTRQAPQAPHES